MKKLIIGTMLASTLMFGTCAYAVPSPTGEMLDGNKETEKETNEGMLDGNKGDNKGDNKGQTNTNGGTGYVQDGISPKTGDVNLAVYEVAAVVFLAAGWVAYSRRKHA